MALLRSEIRVNCRDLLTSTKLPVTQVRFLPSSFTEYLSSYTKSSGLMTKFFVYAQQTNGRLALRLPLDQFSDGELESLTTDSPCDEEINLLKPRHTHQISKLIWKSCSQIKKTFRLRRSFSFVDVCENMLGKIKR